MSPRKFDRFMIDVEIGRNLKLADLTAQEKWCHVAGVLAIAAKSPIRGRLLIGDQRAEARHVAKQADVSDRVAVGALRKLREVGVVIDDEEFECEQIHDFEDWNPAPKSDNTAAARQRRRRDRLRDVTPVTPPSRRDTRDGHADVTPPEVEVEVELEVEGEEKNPQTTALSSKLDRRQVFDRWVEVTGRTNRTVLDAKRSRLIDKALKTYPLDDVLDAVAGWRNSPHHCGENQTGTVYNDLDLLLRDGAHIERFRDLERNPPQPRRGTSASDQAAQWMAQANGGAA